MIATVLLISLTATAGAENDGQMSITIGDAQSEFDRGGIVLAAYLLATGDYGDWTTVNDFAIIKITSRDDGSAWIDQSMKQIHTRIKKLRITPTETATSTAQGKALFTNLEHGIYYIEATKIPDPNLTVSAMLLSTPNKEGAIAVNANAKVVHYDSPAPERTEGEKVEPTSYWPPVKKLIIATRRGERLHIIDEYETALGLGNIQIHVGVCYE